MTWILGFRFQYWCVILLPFVLASSCVEDNEFEALDCVHVVYSEDFENGIPLGWFGLSNCEDQLKMSDFGWMIDQCGSCNIGSEFVQNGSTHAFCHTQRGRALNGRRAILYSRIIRRYLDKNIGMTFQVNNGNWPGEFYVNVNNGLVRKKVFPADSLTEVIDLDSTGNWKEVFVDFSTAGDSLIQLEFIATLPFNDSDGFIAIDNFTLCREKPDGMISNWGLGILALGLIILGVLGIRNMSQDGVDG